PPAGPRAPGRPRGLRGRRAGAAGGGRAARRRRRPRGAGAPGARRGGRLGRGGAGGPPALRRGERRRPAPRPAPGHPAPPRRRRAILRDLVEAVGDLDTVDRLRVATWRLESGAPGDAEQLLALGREALGRLDHVLAERLALAAGGTACAEAGLVLAEALTGQG